MFTISSLGDLSLCVFYKKHLNRHFFYTDWDIKFKLIFNVYLKIIIFINPFQRVKYLIESDLEIINLIQNVQIQGSFYFYLKKTEKHKFIFIMS